MACILNIETATNACSVALSNNREILFEREDTEGPSHSSLLGLFADEAISFSRDNNIKIDAVSISCGPGSYTGLRIGVSEAKGLCYGLKIPLIALKTLLVMSAGVLYNNEIEKSTLLCPMIDARRMEVYAAIYDTELNQIRDITADIVNEDTYESYLIKNKILFFGNGSSKCKSTIINKNASFMDNIYPRARDMVALSEKAFIEKDFVDVAYFEPFYLKDFVTTTPKKKVL